MKAIRSGIVVYATVVSAITLLTLWIGLFIAAPKIIGWYRDLNEEMVLPQFAQQAISNSEGFMRLFWPTVIVAIALLILSYLPRLPILVRSSFRAMIVALSVALLVINGLLYVSVFVAAHDLHSAQELKTRTFVRVLEEFALRESAENRWDEIQQRMAALSQIAAKRLESVDELSRTARSSRVSQLARAVQETQSRDMQKRILATLSMFRDDLPRSKRDEKIVLSAAAAQAGQSFSTSKEFFAWLDQNGGKNGWEPVPLFVFTADKETPPSVEANGLPTATQP